MTSKNDQKVVIAFPHGHEVSARFLRSIMGLLAHDAAGRGRILRGGDFCAVSSGANITNARNEIVDAFLGKCTADWLLFIDTDMVFDGRPGCAGADLVDRLVEAAHPTLRPIVGALCYALRDQEVRPTIYGFSDDNKVIRFTDYPRDQLTQVGATGTGCLLIHRSVLEKMAAAHPKPYQWFMETAFGDIPCGEDITFCVRAGALGYPIYVDTRIKVGHEKPFVVDEGMFLAQKAWKDSQPTAPTFVVIPGRDRHEMTYTLIEQIAQQAVDGLAFLYDNGSEPAYETAPAYRTERIDARDWPLHRMWNDGLDRAATAAAHLGATEWNVAILNNDLEVPHDFLAKLAAGLRRRDDYMLAYPNIHGLDMAPDQVAITTGRGSGHDGRSISGYAFMLKGETGLRIDEQFEWWYGDSDIERQVQARGGQAVCVPVGVNHLEPNKSTVESSERQAMAERDRARFFAKWGEQEQVA